MPLLATAEKIILDEINVENKLSLKPADVAFSTPSIPVEADDIAKANGHNAMVQIEAQPGATAVGYTKVFYDRLDFAELFTPPDGNQPLTIPVRIDAVQSAHDIVPLINQFYGLSLRLSDVIDAAIDKPNWTVHLHATETSLGWIGEIDVVLTPGDALIPSNFDPDTITPYSLPYFNTKVGQGAVYGYPWRFDDYATQLKGFGTTLDDTSRGRLAQIIKNVTGDAWTVYRNPLDFNLKEALIVYNGKNWAEFPTNPVYDNVMAIDLSLYCLNLGGRMYLHYNDPD